MKKLLLILLLLSSQAFATWTIVQRKQGTGTTTTCAVSSLTATVANHLIVYTIATSNNVSLSSISGGGTYTLCGANCEKFQTTAGAVDGAYTLASTAGATTITGTLSASGGNSVCSVEEWSDSTTFSFDVANSVNNAACTSCAGPTITITGSNDLLVQWSSCGGTCSGTPTGWTATYTNGDGLYDKPNTNSSTTAAMTQTSAVNTAAVMAFKETGGATVVPKMTVMGVGP